ncbi:hypothetical protein [Helicobacter sp. T3_23-1059]
MSPISSIFSTSRTDTSALAELFASRYAPQAQPKTLPNPPAQAISKDISQAQNHLDKSGATTPAQSTQNAQNVQFGLDTKSSQNQQDSKIPYTSAEKDILPTLKDFTSSVKQDTDYQQNQALELVSQINKISQIEPNQIQSPQSIQSLERLEDTFTPSNELSAAMRAKSYFQNALIDADSFKSMAQRLHNDGVLSADEMIAVDFLSEKSPNISLKDFDAMIKNDNLSREMRGLIAQLVQKIHLMNYLSGGALA